jgi:hypothetical protein
MTWDVVAAAYIGCNALMSVVAILSAGTGERFVLATFLVAEVALLVGWWWR